MSITDQTWLFLSGAIIGLTIGFVGGMYFMFSLGVQA